MKQGCRDKVTVLDSGYRLEVGGEFGAKMSHANDLTESLHEAYCQYRMHYCAFVAAIKSLAVLRP